MEININGNFFRDGDKIKAWIRTGSGPSCKVFKGVKTEYDEKTNSYLVEDAVINIPEQQLFLNHYECYICQNYFNGGEAVDKKGYDCSWHVKVNSETGEIMSSDTFNIHPFEVKSYLEQKIATLLNDETSPPEDWEMEEELPKDF